MTLDYFYVDETYPDEAPDGQLTLHVGFTDKPEQAHYGVVGIDGDRVAVARMLRELASHVERGAGVH